MKFPSNENPKIDYRYDSYENEETHLYSENLYINIIREIRLS